MLKFGAFNPLHGFPPFLVLSTSSDYASAPGRTALYSAHNEGWGLYSEDLGVEMGVFDRMETLGYLSGKLLRATRS